jgi:cytochrome c oxidase assembly factor CtaG
VIWSGCASPGPGKVEVTAPDTGTLLTDWTWEPSILIGLVLLTAAYIYAAGPLRRRLDAPPIGRRHIVFFVLAQTTLVVALLSPLDELGDVYLFSAHMVQHLLLASLWPPLMLASIPTWLARHVLGKGFPSQVFEFATYPVIAIILFNLDIYAWHIPVLYDLTLTNEGVHIVEHLTFMAFGFINFWPILSPIPEMRPSYPLQVLYLFADGMFMMVLGIVFTFSPVVFYTPYLAAPQLWGISHLSDQQLGGLIMWYPGNLPYGVLLVSAFYRWFEGGGSVSPSQASTIGPPLP